MYKLATVLLLLFSMLLLTQCSVFSPVKLQPNSNYTISNLPNSNNQNLKLKQTASSKTLFLASPSAASGYNTNDMIYITVPYKLKSFANNHWVAPPADLLSTLLANALRRQHYFHAIVTPPFSGLATYQLNTQLLVLQQEFLQPESRVRLTLEITLIQSANGSVLASRVFTIVIPAPENNPYSGVVAANLAANMLAKQISQFVVQAAAAGK